jgi:hypothetical protein
MGIFFGYKHIMMPNDQCNLGAMERMTTQQQLFIIVEEITWMLMFMTPAKVFVN